MAKITPNFLFVPADMEKQAGQPTKPTKLTLFGRMLQTMWQNLAFTVNGHLSFGDGTNSDNIDGVWASVADTGAANADFTITHNLGRIPVGYILMTSAQGTELYTGSVAATKTQITLRSAQAHDTLTIFIL